MLLQVLENAYTCLQAEGGVYIANIEISNKQRKELMIGTISKALFLMFFL